MLGFTKFKINRLVNRRELYSNFSYNKWNQLDTGSKREKNRMQKIKQ